jgi:hypothetical protein
MIKIAFHTPVIDVRGTCVCLYDYADYNEKILGNTSIIIVPEYSNNDNIALLKFIRRFKVIMYNDLESAISDCDILYCIKYGKFDGIVSKKIKTVIHCVFDLSEPHGDVYVAVSETLAHKYGMNDFVPHMIGLQPSKTKENLRYYLNIPEDAIVFGRYGGMDTFDLELAHNAIKRAVRDVNNLYFVFINTPIFDIHPNIIFLSKITDLDEKNRFICTCDGYLECGSLGHTFGLAIGEFSVNNKPIIAYNGPVWNTAHLNILKDKGIYFKTEEELYEILITFDKNLYCKMDNNCYKEYSPDKVMKKFSNIFL